MIDISRYLKSGFDCIKKILIVACLLNAKYTPLWDPQLSTGVTFWHKIWCQRTEPSIWPAMYICVSMVNTNFIGQAEWDRGRGNACRRDMGELDNDAKKGEGDVRGGL